MTSEPAPRTLFGDELAEAYHHQPLKDSGTQIRTLTLYPAADFDDDLRCDLQIEDAPHETDSNAWGEYSAVSYAWGDTTLSHGARIGARRLAITANLDVALRSLRRTDGQMLRWIDRICIDQANVAEKSEQVGILRRIFSCAEEVLVWLGPGIVARTTPSV